MRVGGPPALPARGRHSLHPGPASPAMISGVISIWKLEAVDGVADAVCLAGLRPGKIECFAVPKEHCLGFGERGDNGFFPRPRLFTDIGPPCEDEGVMIRNTRGSTKFERVVVLYEVAVPYQSRGYGTKALKGDVPEGCNSHKGPELIVVSCWRLTRNPCAADKQRGGFTRPRRIRRRRRISNGSST